MVAVGSQLASRRLSENFKERDHSEDPSADETIKFRMDLRKMW
jgi:hypothetical protein